MTWGGNFAKGFAQSGFFDQITNMIQKKHKLAKEKEEAAAKEKETTAKNNISNKIKTYKANMASLDKNHPDWHHANFNHINLVREQARLSGDPDALPDLTPDEYKSQFVKYEPEKYDKWGSFTSANPNNIFVPSQEDIQAGEDFVVYQRQSKTLEDKKGDIVDLGEKAEVDLNPKLKKLEKQKEAHTIYNEIKNMTDEEVMNKFGFSKEDLDSFAALGKLGQVLVGDVDIQPVWGEREQAQYVNLVREFNQAQKLQGTGYTYSDIIGRTQARQKSLLYPMDDPAATEEKFTTTEVPETTTVEPGPDAFTSGDITAMTPEEFTSFKKKLNLATDLTQEDASTMFGTDDITTVVPGYTEENYDFSESKWVTEPSLIQKIKPITLGDKESAEIKELENSLSKLNRLYPNFARAYQAMKITPI